MAMEARRTGGAESGHDRTGQDRVLQEVEWWARRRRGRRQQIGATPTLMKKILKLGGGERDQSCGILVGRETGEWTPQKFGIEGRQE